MTDTLDRDILDDPPSPDEAVPGLVDHQRPYPGDRADWAMRQIARLRHERATLADRFDRELERIKQRRTDRLDILNREIAHYEEPLRQWHAALLAAGEAGKTIHLPHGDLKARTVNPTVTVDDMDAVANWARRAHPELLAARVSIPELRKAVAILDLVDEPAKVIDPATGEIVPGCAVTPGTTTFTVSPTEGDW